ncbi:N-6 DNA methylase, partial [Patescibacteria group bacterium]|nr:N-6 DNA methylase [Patescibacteria group bacterium]
IVRHSFGEYYTPYWLADLVIDSAFKEVQKKKNFRLIDTTCGSGTFLINAIKRQIEKNGDINSIINNIKGIDLNPIAVLMAKVNYFINISPYIEKQQIIEIPVYLGDATYTPQVVFLDGVKCLTYDLLTSTMLPKGELKIVFPYSLVEKKEFISIMEELEYFILRKDEKKARNFIFNEINKRDLKPKVIKNIENFIKELIFLESTNLNSIWLRVFANYLKTGALEKFDLVVGNPPWVSWSALPEKYREKVKSKCRLEGLFSEDKNIGGNNLNICALIANKSLETFMKSNGVLSYIMPKSILFNKSFEGFRNFYIGDKLKRAYLQKVLDWEKGGKPFENVGLPFCIYIFSYKKKDYSKGIELKRYIKKRDIESLRNRFISFDKMKKSFNIKSAYLVQFPNEENNGFTIVDKKNMVNRISMIVGKNYYKFRKGVGAKGEVFRLYFKANINKDYAKFGLFKKRGSLLNLSEEEIILEKKFVKPLVLSPDIKDFKCDWKNLYVAFPYIEGEKQPIEEKSLKIIAPKLHEYFKKNYSEIIKQSSFNQRVQNSKEFYNLIRIGYYCYANNFVAIRDNTKMTACVVKKIKTHWGEYKKPLFDGHVSYISEDQKKDDFITESEAYYISYILNLPEVKVFVENSTDSRSIGTKLPIKIENFDKNNPKHIDFVNKAKFLEEKYKN